MTLVRYAALGLPLLMLALAARADRTKAGRAGAMLAFLAVAVGVIFFHEGVPSNAWTYADVDGAFRGTPVDLVLGWSLLWGAIPVLLRRWINPPMALGGLFLLDALFMPRLEPLLHLGPQWMVADVIALLAIALPAQLLGRFTADRSHLRLRVLGQALVFTALSVWLVPTAAFTFGDGGWPRDGRLIAICVELGVLIAAPALRGVAEFAASGGTPYPWDPPKRLVTTGPYAYVANPMQLGLIALLLLAAAATHSRSLVVAATAALLFSVGVAAIHERETMRERFGAEWVEYRRHVRDWLPRWRPHATVTATLWLDFDCPACVSVRDFLLRRDPVELLIRPATEHGEVLWRAEYTGDGGQSASGVAAVARACGHVNLGWAYAGWLLQLPGIVWLAQLLVDALLVSPHPVGPGKDRHVRCH